MDSTSKAAKLLGQRGIQEINFIAQGCFIFKTHLNKALKQRNNDRLEWEYEYLKLIMCF